MSGKRDLVVMATQIAESLVGAALERLLADARTASGDLSIASISQAIDARSERLALPPGPRPRRTYTRRTPEPVGPPRKKKAGWTPERRRKFMATVKAKGLKPRRGRPRQSPAVKAGSCFRCDHPSTSHAGPRGECTVPGCVCKELYT